MRFPFSLTRTMTTYLLKKKLSGDKKFPLVLMLEPLHACNLTCTGCGRIREYASTIKDKLTVDECLAAVDECGAPCVSICGGEPMIYPWIEELVAKILERKKHIYLCTNGMFTRKKLAGFKVTDRFFWNVHLDGMEASHDKAVEREGVFTEAIEGIKAAKAAGFLVCTNTTVYKETDMNEIAVLLSYLTELGVDGFMMSPAYGYAAVHATNPDGAQDIFMTREDIHEKFRAAKKLLSSYRLNTSPVYLEFLRGERDLRCAAWANPTRNLKGWKGPCYLITDTHHSTYRDLIDKTDWDKLGRGNDPRCENCMVHCGFDAEDLQDGFYKEFSTEGTLTRRAFGSPRGLHSVQEMNDPKAWSGGLPAMGGVGTASALAKFYQAAIGAIESPLNERVRQAMATVRVSGDDRVLIQPTAFSCGCQLDPLDAAGRKIRQLYGPSIHAFGHPGAGGSHALGDPDSGVSFAYVMNQMELSVLPGPKSIGMVQALFS